MTTTSRPKFQLSRLRAIAWSEWNPIGLDLPEGGPDDEYDGYVLHAAVQLSTGGPLEDVADYLACVETEHMGFSPRDDVRVRAQRTATALRAYLDEPHR